MLKLTQQGGAEADPERFLLGHVNLPSPSPERGLIQRELELSMFKSKSRMEKSCLSRRSQWKDEYMSHESTEQCGFSTAIFTSGHGTVAYTLL